MDLHRGRAQFVPDGRVLPVGVDDDDLVLGAVEQDLVDLGLAVHRLARAGGAQEERVAVHQRGTRGEDQVLRQGVHPVADAVLLEELLGGEGDHDGRRSGSEGAEQGQPIGRNALKAASCM